MYYLIGIHVPIAPHPIPSFIIVGTYMSWGLWLLDRRWAKPDDDLDSGFFWSILPVALLTWLALYLAGA
jgi:hypothetical protein